MALRKIRCQFEDHQRQSIVEIPGISVRFLGARAVVVAHMSPPTAMNIADTHKARERLNLEAQVAGLGEESPYHLSEPRDSEMSEVEVLCYEWCRGARQVQCHCVYRGYKVGDCVDQTGWIPITVSPNDPANTGRSQGIFVARGVDALYAREREVPGSRIRWTSITYS